VDVARRVSLLWWRVSKAGGGSILPCWVNRSPGRAALLSPFDRLIHDRQRVDGEIRDLAGWLELDLTLPG
jgi:uncharacterized protein YcaQ